MGSNVSVPETKIVLVGKTGHGKSTAGNTILGKKIFKAKALANSVTAKSVSADGIVNGRKITVINTSRAFDTDRDDLEIKSDIIKPLIECAEGVDAVVFVLKVGRYEQHDIELVKHVLNIFKEEHILKHTVMLFTFGEKLEGKTIEEFIKTNSQLQELVNECEGRCHVIDGKHWNDCDSGYKSNSVQVKGLLDTIDKMVKENGSCTNELLQKVDETIQEEMKINKENLSLEEKREKAKKIVHNKILEKMAGTASGVVTGAVLGVGLAFFEAVALLAMFDPLYQLLKTFSGPKPVTYRGTVRFNAAEGGGEAATVEEAAAEGGAEGGAEVAEAVTGEAAAAGGTAAEAVVAAAGTAAAEGVVAAGGTAAAEAVVAAGGTAAAEAVVAAGGTAAAEAVVAAGGTAAAEAVVAAGGTAAAEAVVAAGGTAAAEAVVAAGTAAAEAVVAAGGTAAAEAVVAAGGTAAAEAAVVAAGGTAAAEAVVAAGTAAEVVFIGAAETGAAAGAAAGPIAACAAVEIAGLAGAVGGGVTGWKEAEDADSVGDAIIKAAKANYKNTKSVFKHVKELF